MDLKTVLAPPQHPGEFLHPVVYACTAVMLLCLLASAATYLVHRSAIRISRKGRHSLLNLCLHTALTFTAFAGGINRTAHPMLCQAVGIVLHYSTLSTMLWIAVTARNIYTQVTKKALPCPGTDQPPSSRQPLLRFYLISGGVPFIICGVTAATNIRNYGPEDEDSAYCWMAWEPSLGAFYGPAALIALVTCLYLLGAYVQLRRHPERRYELRERLAGPEAGRSPGAPRRPPPGCDALAASLLQNEHPFQAQLRAAAFTLLLFAAAWAFGALAVSQGPVLDMVFSCLYGAFCVTLGLFVLIHHCAKRDDVWHCWWSCCPARPGARPAPDANGDALGPAAGPQDSPCPGRARGCGHCKAPTLQAARCCAPGRGEPAAGSACAHLRQEDALERRAPLHLRRLRAAAAEHEYAYHIPSSPGGSPRSSRTDSGPSSLGSPAAVRALACCAPGDPFPLASPPEGGGGGSPALYGCAPRPGRGAAHFEMLRRTPSLPFSGPGQNGLLKGEAHEALPYGADSTGNIRTGPWKNETTV